MKASMLRLAVPLAGALILLFSILTSTAGTTPARAQALPDANCWSIFPATKLGYPQGASQLQAIAVGPQQPGKTAPVWAVGYKVVPGGALRPRPLATHWDGTQWLDTAVPLPEGTDQGVLAGVAVLAADDVWAVGYAELAASTPPGPLFNLTVHWNGSAWSTVPSPNPGGPGNSLTAVSAVAPGDVWASGVALSPQAPVLLHWNGSAWSQVRLPATSASDAPAGLVAPGPSDVWVAAGDLWHWNGQTWTKFPVANVTLPGVQLRLTARAGDDVWAVGYGGGLVAAHWDGRQWRALPAFDLGQASGLVGPGTSWAVTSAAAVAPNNLWVGGYSYQRNSPHTMFVLHWDGSQWAVVSSPVNTYSTAVQGLAGAGGTLWVAGSGSNLAIANTAALILRHASGDCAAPAPTATKPLDPPVPLPGTGSVVFPETGQTLRGLFLAYWQAHGGLMQQGYPISPVIGEVSDLNGRPYTVQYFERAVFEYHPEYRAPFDVLLSQLGTYEYHKKYPAGAPGQKPNNDPGSVYVPETGKRIGGSFLEYWRANGGLMQQGYPISDEFTEVNELDGKPYTVQYFERAVFEYHPENAKPFDVLLSHLGRFQYNARYGQGAGQAGPALLARNVNMPLAAGGYSLWFDAGQPRLPLYAYGNAGKQIFQVAAGSGRTYIGSVASDGAGVVWVDQENKRIMGLDLASRRQYTVLENLTDAQTDTQLALDHGTLYRTYHSYSPSSDVGIIARDLASGRERTVIRYTGPAPATETPGTPEPPITPVGIFHIAAANGLLAWSTIQFGDARRSTSASLHALRPDGSLPDTTIASDNYYNVLFSLAPDGQHIAYAFAAGDPAQWGSPALRPHLYTVSDRSDRVLSTAAATDLVFAAGKIAWVEGTYVPPDQTPHSVVRLYDLATGAITTALEKNSRLAPVGLLDAKTLVYTDVDGETVTANLYLWPLP